MGPTYRRGFHPADYRHYNRFTFHQVDPWGGDEVWRRLVEADSDGRGIEGTEAIAAVMGVARATSYKYRRLFDALGLADVIPGVRGELHSALHVLDNDPDAFARVHHEVAGVDLDLYVVSRGHNTPAYVGSLARSARSARPAVVWLTRAGDEMVIVSEEGDTTLNHYRSRTSTFNVVSPAPIAAVVLVTRANTHPLSTERSEAASERLLGSQDPPLTVPGLMAAWGCSRKTAYRRIERGDAVRVGRGRYRLSTAVEGGGGPATNDEDADAE